MRVSDHKRMLFIHIQKTGGSTIDAVLDADVPDARLLPDTMRHATMKEILGAHPELSSYWIFGFVRNPWARMVSWWSMIDHIAAHPEKPWAVKGLKRSAFLRKAIEYRDFESFVIGGHQSFPRLRRSQISYLVAGQRRADFIGRVETFSGDLAKVRKQLGLPPTDMVPRRNTTAHGAWRNYYNDDTRQVIAEVFADDIAAFDYSFDAPHG